MPAHECVWCDRRHPAWVWDLVRQLVADYGPNVLVTLEAGDQYLVPRAYIGLHGIRAEDVPALAAWYGWGKP